MNSIFDSDNKNNSISALGTDTCFVSKRRVKELFSLLIFILYVSFCAIVAWEHPSYNSDVLPYIGAAISIDDQDASIIHKKSYALVKQSIPAKVYSAIISPPSSGSKHFEDLVGNYFEVAAKDAECFYQELPFFYVKPLYVFILYLAIKLQLNPVAFMVVFSIACSICISFLLFNWIRKYVSTAWSSLWCILILSAAGLQDIFSITTSDMAALLFIFLAAYWYFEKDKFDMAMLSLFIGTLFRLDAALVPILLLIYDSLILKKRNILRFKSLLYFSTFIILPIVIQMLVGAYSWSTLFYYNFIQHLNYPKVSHPSISILQYITVVVQGLRMKAPANVAWMFVIFAVLILLLRSQNDKIHHIFVFSITYICTRYFLFPILAQRFFIVFYILIAIVFVKEFGMLIGNYPNFSSLLKINNVKMKSIVNAKFALKQVPFFNAAGIKPSAQRIE